MSARQRARVANQVSHVKRIAQAGDNNESSSEGEDIARKVVTTKTFQFETSSGSSEDVSDDCADTNYYTQPDLEEKTERSPVLMSKIPNVNSSSYDELAYLDSVIVENSTSQAAVMKSELSILFEFADGKSLDLVAALKRRQGQHEGGVEAAGNRRHRTRGLGRGISVAIGVKRFLFGAPSEDWLRPPAFLAGGLGMDRVGTGSEENEFTFTWSPEFRFLHSQYQYVESSGDPNLLVMFLAHFPSHPQGLMQLSRVYAGMGQHEKSFDLVRRALYVLECASMEAFRPSAMLISRLNPEREENKIYFEVLIRYLLECSTQGCHTVAVEVCRYLLSLWPADSSKYQLLLSLDHYIVAAQQHDRMLSFCGLGQNESVSQPSNVKPDYAELGADPTIISHPDIPLAAALSFTFTSPYRFENSPGVTATATDVSLQDLPNWWFSLALSAFTAERRRSTGSIINNSNHANNPTTTATSNFNNVTSSTLPSATVLLMAALIRWPCVLKPLLEKVTSDQGPIGAMAVRLLGGTTSIAPWKKLLEHELFRKAMDRVPAPLHSFLGHVSEVYAMRNFSLWGKEDELKWLVDTCTSLVTALGPAQADMDENNSFSDCLKIQDTQYARLMMLVQPSDENSPLLQYSRTGEGSSSSLPDLFFAAPRQLALPADLNPLDPSLDDPVYVLSGAVRFRDFMDIEGRFLFPVPAPYVTTAKQSKGLHGARGNGNNNGALVRPDRANIDLNLPLMQLFLATFFPWIFVPPIKRS